MTARSYLPTPGSLPYRILAELQALPPGEVLLADDVHARYGVPRAQQSGILQCAIRAGAIAKRYDGVRVLGYSLAVGTQRGAAFRAEHTGYGGVVISGIATSDGTAVLTSHQAGYLLSLYRRRSAAATQEDRKCAACASRFRAWPWARRKTCSDECARVIQAEAGRALLAQMRIRARQDLQAWRAPGSR